MALDGERLCKTILAATRSFVAGDYVALESLTGGRRLAASDMARVVAEYPYHLAMPPGDSSGELVDWEDGIYEIEGARPPQYFVEVRLWERGDTGQVRPSDLTMFLRLTDSGADGYAVELDDLGVE